MEREWFRLLLLVQGVGAKVALSVLGRLRPADLASAIALQDKATISRAPGVGPKVAARICTELKDKAPAVSALVNLGYGQAQASAAIAAAIADALAVAICHAHHRGPALRISA